MSALCEQRKQLLKRLCPILDELGVEYLTIEPSDVVFAFPVYLADYGSAGGMGIDVIDAPLLVDKENPSCVSRVNPDEAVMTKKLIREALKDWGYFGSNR